MGKFTKRAEEVIGLQLQGVLTKEAWDKHVLDVTAELEKVEAETLVLNEKKVKDLEGSRDWAKREYQELYDAVYKCTGLYSHIGWIRDRLIPHLNWLAEQQQKVGPLQTFKDRIERVKSRLIQVLDGEDPDDN